MCKINRVLFILLISLTFSSLNTFSQKLTYSPYSRYGVGDIQDLGYGRNVAMGGTGIALRSNNYLNDLNPASYTSMDSLSFFFEAGIRGLLQKFETTDNTGYMSDINFDYFALGFRIAKWGAASLGIRPASATGYTFANTSYDELLGNIIQEAKGTGSINRAYIGLGLDPWKFLSAGLHFTYIFGNLTSINTIDYPSLSKALSYGRSQNTHINDVYFDFGLQGIIPLKNDHSLILGATFSPKTPVNGYTEETVARGTNIEVERQLYVDSDTLSYTKTDFKDNSLTMPLSYGFGIAYELKNKLIITADYQTNDWGDVTFPDEFSKTTKRTRYALGAEFTPNERNPKSYMAKVRYRLGTHYLKDYIVLNNHQLKDFGISFGAAFPLKRSKTSLNVAFKLGERGTTDFNLVKEKYLYVYLDITLGEMWFMKQKFE